MLVHSILDEGDATKTLKRYMGTIILGSYNELRAYIELSNYTEHFHFKTSDGCLLDCMLIKPTEQNNFAIRPLVILCNPNGAAYETLFHDVNKRLIIRLIGQISISLWVLTS